MSSGVRTRLLDEQHRRAASRDREVRQKAEGRSARRAGVPICERVCLLLLVVTAVLLLGLGIIGLAVPQDDVGIGQGSFRARIASISLVASVVVPVVWLAIWVRCARQSRAERQRAAYYADALLEEKLRGEGVREFYDVEGEHRADAGTVILLPGATAPRTLTRLFSSAIARTFRVVSIDVPGHGQLQSVMFSLNGAMRILQCVLQRVKETGSEHVILAAYGSGGYVALHAIAEMPEAFSGLLLAGPMRDLSSTGCCGFTGFWSGLARMIWWAHLSDRRRRGAVLSSTLPEHLRTTAVAEDFNRASWATVVDEVHGKQLFAAVSDFAGPVMVLGKKSYIESVRSKVTSTNVRVRLMDTLSSTTIPPLDTRELARLSEAHVEFLGNIVKPPADSASFRSRSLRLVQ